MARNDNQSSFMTHAQSSSGRLTENIPPPKNNDNNNKIATPSGEEDI